MCQNVTCVIILFGKVTKFAHGNIQNTLKIDNTLDFSIENKNFWIQKFICSDIIHSSDKSELRLEIPSPLLLLFLSFS